MSQAMIKERRAVLGDRRFSTPQLGLLQVNTSTTSMSYPPMTFEPNIFISNKKRLEQRTGKERRHSIVRAKWLRRYLEPALVVMLVLLLLSFGGHQAVQMSNRSFIRKWIEAGSYKAVYMWKGFHRVAPINN